MNVLLPLSPVPTKEKRQINPFVSALTKNAMVLPCFWTNYHGKMACTRIYQSTTVHLCKCEGLSLKLLDIYKNVGHFEIITIS